MTTSLSLITLALLAGGIISPAVAQDCPLAGTAVQVQARVAGTDTITVRYTVLNHTPDSLRWISIGAGSDQERTVAVVDQRPAVTETPAGWRGMVVYPEETAYVQLWWEARDAGARIAPGRSANGFSILVPSPHLVRPNMVGPYGPVHPIDFTTLPFTVGTRGGCWWGHVTAVR